MGGGEHGDRVGSVGQNEPVNWTPRGADPATHHALVDGIPLYMVSPLRAWFVDEYSFVASGTYRRAFRLDRMERYDLAARSAPYVELLRGYGPETLFERLTAEEALQIIDWTVFDNASEPHTKQRNEKLDGILKAGSSKWKVGMRDGVVGLEERVPQGVQDAAEAVMAKPGHAGKLLSEAWHAAFGINPDPERAYAKAIKAVEAAAIPVVSPKNKGASLGTVVAQMRDQGNWKLDLTREHATHTTQQVVLGMAQALWTGQNDRHAGQPGYTPSTPAEAEAAVMLAVPLVQWFSSGAIARRS